MEQTVQEILNIVHIKKPVFDYMMNSTPENMKEWYTNFMIRLSEGGKVPMPLMDVQVVSVGENKVKNMVASDLYPRYEDKEGKIWIPLYTDRAEIGEEYKDKKVVEVPISDIIKAAYVNKSINGVLINPKKFDFPLHKETLEAMIVEEKSYGKDWGNALDAITGNGF